MIVNKELILNSEINSFSRKDNPKLMIHVSALSPFSFIFLPGSRRSEGVTEEVDVLKDSNCGVT